MKDKARMANHPIHPMLIPFPIGLWIFALVADFIFRAGGNPAWATVAYYSMAGGIIGAIAAAIPGFIDFLDMKPSRTKSIAVRHMLLNVVALLLFMWNFLLREPGTAVGAFPFFLSIVGVLLILISGWLGGHMVYVKGMAVDETEVCERPHEMTGHVTRH
jgi:uncharacterized membrane protein